MKNFVGITPLTRYGWKDAPNYDRSDLHRHDYTPEAVAHLVRDLTKAARPDLAIVDSPVNVKDRLGPGSCSPAPISSLPRRRLRV